MHAGVYAVGHAAPSRDGDYIAAVPAGGEGAVLSHRAAAHKLDLLRGTPPRPEITVPTTAHRRRPGVVIHRVRSLHRLDVASEQNIPITIVPRILLDLAPAMSPPQLARACHEAWVRHNCGPDKIEACILRNPRKPGAGKLRRALGTDLTLSFLEDALLELLAAHDLPAPRTNIEHNQDKVDCYWAHLDLTVELVSYRYHASRHAFEHDVARKRRSNSLAYTYADVVERGAATAAELRPLLTASGREAAATAAPQRAPS